MPRDNRSKRIPQVELVDPHCLRVNIGLVREIGLDESILFLQIEFLVSISQIEKDGRLWTYQTLQQLHEDHFPDWSVATISRLLTKLEARELITVGNYNKAGYDRTRWFAINPIGVDKLKSINIFQFEKSILQNETSIFQNEKSILQFETTIPETTEETTEERDITSREEMPFDPPADNQIPEGDPYERNPDLQLVRWFEENGRGVIRRPLSYVRVLMDGARRDSGEPMPDSEYRTIILNALHDLGPPPAKPHFDNWQFKLNNCLKNYRKTGVYTSPNEKSTGVKNGNGYQKSVDRQADSIRTVRASIKADLSQIPGFEEYLGGESDGDDPDGRGHVERDYLRLEHGT